MKEKFARWDKIPEGLSETINPNAVWNEKAPDYIWRDRPEDYKNWLYDEKCPKDMALKAKMDLKAEADLLESKKFKKKISLR